jgi:C-terminal processing protease CtpA/Prc
MHALAGLLSIKHVTPDGPASHMSEVQKGDFLVAIDGLTTLGMPMHQVSTATRSACMQKTGLIRACMVRCHVFARL